jgi:hypothetical protein
MFDIMIKNYTGNEKDILKAIVDRLWLQRIRAGIPVMVGVVGKSSSGKSVFTIGTQEEIYKGLGLQDIVSFVEPCMLIKPSDYAPKVDALLFSKECKDFFTVQLDEAKFLIATDDWQQFKNKATRTITATCRAIKPMIFFLLAQRRSDIEARTRQALDYYVEVVRKPGEKPYAMVFEVYEDKRKFNDPDFKTRPITVCLQYKDGRVETIVPRIHFSMPSTEVWDKYKSIEMPTKSSEIKSLLEQMQKEETKLRGETDIKIKKFVEHLMLNPAELEKIGSLTKRGWKVKKDDIARMGYTSKEIIEIEDLVTKSYSKFESKESVVNG